MIGATLGSYKIVSEIGSGGMGVVYLAEHTLIGRKAAVKLLRSDMPQEYVDRFFNEAKAAAMLHHPGLVDVFDFGQNKDGSAFIVMEFLQGESLAQRLDREPRLPIPIALSIARSVATALQVAHEQGIVHRDLKPANIFLIADPDAPAGVRTKVLDFGIAKLVRDRDARSVKTQSGAVIGTPRYMSPEQCKNARNVDGRADIYSLGCILYEMLLGVAPFDYDSWAELVGAHIYEKPPQPSEIDPKLPADVETLVCKMIEKAPDQRFQSMQELAQSLEVLLIAQGSAARPTPPAGVRAVTVTPPHGVRKFDSGRDATMPAATGELAVLPPTDQPPPAEPTKRAQTGKPADTTPTKRAQTGKPADTTPTKRAQTGKPADTTPTKAEIAPTLDQQRDITTVPVRARRKLPWLAIGIGGAGVVALGIAALVVLGKENKAPEPETAVIVVDHRGSDDDSATTKTVEPPPVSADAGVIEPRPDAGAKVTHKIPTDTDVDALTRTFGKQSPAITACFNKHPPTGEQVSVRIQIDTRGAVRGAEVLPASVGNSPLGTCIAEVARATSFGPQPKPATFRVPLHKLAR